MASAPRKDSQLIADALERTGFPLEHRTGRAFQDAGWTLFTNKYYVDNVSGDAREIDLIAYKVSESKEFSVVSGVIVSCKKTTDRKWTFLTRQITKNPNKNLAPLHYWSNIASLSYMLEKNDEQRAYQASLSKVAPLLWEAPKREVFATQELVPIYKGNGTSTEVASYNPGNDSAFFASIVTLMKSQAYELNRLGDRLNRPRVYVFSLLSVMEGDMIEVDYDAEPPVARDIDRQPYIAHYIINRNEQFSRINFVSPQAIEEVVAACGEAHSASAKHMHELHSKFYSEVITDSAKRKVLLPVFAKRAAVVLSIWADQLGKIAADEVDLLNNSDGVEVAVFTDAPDSAIDEANQDERVRARLAKAFLDIYKYSGPFRIGRDIPF